ncbi:hypothetical protein BH11BAC1_BH11BAC1_24340 [soil metagenome]
MKKCTFLISWFIFYISCGAFSQGGIWTWISGDSNSNSLGVYGTQGVPSVNNHPPANFGYVDWKDRQGNFWVFGGGFPEYSDLWKYDPLTNEWTWVKGNGIANLFPTYGTKGIAAPTNTPGRRTDGSASWIDTTGNLWLFGGASARNDLWKYDISANEWTWVYGDSTGNSWSVHGTLGVPSPNNIAGARDRTISSWTDSLNNLWLFGGRSFDDSGHYNMMNDLIEYNIATNEWTWMAGSALYGAVGSYGIKGIANPLNVPSSRETFSKWKDPDGNFWLMGGRTGDFQYYLLNDVWKFDVNSNVWTWMSGTSSINDLGNYLSTCVLDVNRTPSSRHEHHSTVTDNCGRFWLFGGTLFGTLNDLWLFNPSQIKWEWVSGTTIANDPGVYGTLGMPSVSNLPPARCAANAWWGDDNKLYMFGGALTDIPTYGSDLWVFDPDTNCVSICNCIIPAPVITQNSDTLSVPQNYLSYQWYLDSLPIIGATNYFYIATQSGNYDVVTANNIGCTAEAQILNVVAGISHLPPINQQLFISPNPVQTTFTIIINPQLPITQLEIYNLLGEKVYPTVNRESFIVIPITIRSESFPPGIYFVKVSTEKGSSVQKLVKQ